MFSLPSLFRLCFPLQLDFLPMCTYIHITTINSIWLRALPCLKPMLNVELIRHPRNDDDCLSRPPYRRHIHHPDLCFWHLSQHNVLSSPFLSTLCLCPMCTFPFLSNVSPRTVSLQMTHLGSFLYFIPLLFPLYRVIGMTDDLPTASRPVHLLACYLSSVLFMSRWHMSLHLVFSHPLFLFPCILCPQ